MTGLETVEISASLLSAPRARLVEVADALVRGGIQRLHWDVFDGAFAAGDGFDVAQAAYVHGQLDIPGEAHIMARDAKALAAAWSEVCERVIVHVEQDDGPGPSIEAVRGSGASAAVAINPGTPLSAVTPWISEAPTVLVMSLQPGHAGESFLPTATERVAALRSTHPSLRLGVDGGVTQKHGQAAIRAGARWIISGTDLLSASDPAAWIQAVTARIGHS